MTKLQKVWFWLGLGLFVISEVVWGPILNALSSIVHVPLHSFYTEHRLFNDHPYFGYLIIVAEIALVGLLVRIIYFSSANRANKITSYIVFGLLCLCLLGILFF